MSSSANSHLKVLILGHSHIYWLGEHARTGNPAGQFTDFWVRDQSCKVNYLGIRGATLPSLSSPAAMTRIAKFHADVCVLHLGGNDLDAGSAPDPVLVALDIQRLAVKLLGLGVKQVAVCQVIRRRKWRNFSYEECAARVFQVNDYLEHFCNDTEGIFFWRHKRLWNSIRPVFRRDGVHFSDIGNFRLYRSIRGAVIKAVKQVTDGGV